MLWYSLSAAVLCHIVHSKPISWGNTQSSLHVIDSNVTSWWPMIVFYRILRFTVHPPSYYTWQMNGCLWSFSGDLSTMLSAKPYNIIHILWCCFVVGYQPSLLSSYNFLSTIDVILKTWTKVHLTYRATVTNDITTKHSVQSLYWFLVIKQGKGLIIAGKFRSM